MLLSIARLATVFVLLFGTASAGTGGTGGGGNDDSGSGEGGGGKKGGESGSGSGKRARRSRNLISKYSVVVQEDDPDYRAIARSCGDFEYDGALYVDTHLYGVAIPQAAAAYAGCPFIVTHSNFIDENSQAEKEILFFDTKKVGQRFFGEEGTYHMGKYKLSTILNAFAKADPAAAGVYDVLKNTCANYMIELAQGLDAKVDSQVTAFVAKRLFESNSKEILENIRNHMDFSSYFGDRNLRADIGDEELIEMVVESQAAPLLQ